MGSETGSWELRVSAPAVLARLLNQQGQPAEAADTAYQAAQALLTVRDTTRAAGHDEALLEDDQRLHVLGLAVRLLQQVERGDEARALVDAAAWPPLAEALGAEGE